MYPPFVSSNTIPGSLQTAQANFSYRQDANIAHLPPYECPTIPIFVESTSVTLANTSQALAAAYANADQGCIEALLMSG